VFPSVSRTESRPKLPTDFIIPYVWGHPASRGLWGALRTPLTCCKVAPLHLLRHHGATDKSTYQLLVASAAQIGKQHVCLSRLLPNATVSFVISVLRSVRPSVRKEQLVFHWTDFYEISYLRIWRKSQENRSVIKI